MQILYITSVKNATEVAISSHLVILAGGFTEIKMRRKKIFILSYYLESLKYLPILSPNVCLVSDISPQIKTVEEGRCSGGRSRIIVV